MTQKKKTAKESKRPNKLINEINYYTHGESKSYFKSNNKLTISMTPQRNEFRQTQNLGSEISIKNEGGDPIAVSIPKK